MLKINQFYGNPSIWGIYEVPLLVILFILLAITLGFIVNSFTDVLLKSDSEFVSENVSNSVLKNAHIRVCMIVFGVILLNIISLQLTTLTWDKQVFASKLTAQTNAVAQKVKDLPENNGKYTVAESLKDTTLYAEGSSNKGVITNDKAFKPAFIKVGDFIYEISNSKGDISLAKTSYVDLKTDNTVEFGTSKFKFGRPSEPNEYSSYLKSNLPLTIYLTSIAGMISALSIMQRRKNLLRL